MKNNSKGRRFRRGIYVLPTLFTIGTIFCGFFAVTNALKGEFNLAAIAIGFAVVFDGLDGRIARMTNSCSEFGVQIDSLADVVTFGLAPAILAYLWGVRAIPRGVALFSAPSTTRLDRLLWFPGVRRHAAGALQHSECHASTLGKRRGKAFVGMPIPAGAAMIAAAVHFSPGASGTLDRGNTLECAGRNPWLPDGQHSEIPQFQACRSEEPPAIRQFRAAGHAGRADLLLLAGRSAPFGRRVCVLGTGVEGSRPGQAQTGGCPEGRQAQAGRHLTPGSPSRDRRPPAALRPKLRGHDPNPVPASRAPGSTRKPFHLLYLCGNCRCLDR